MRIHTVFSISLSMIVVGCAIRPLPKNVTRDTTFSIVEKIRCEARDALVDQIKRELRKEIDRTPHEVKINRDLLKVIAAGNTSPDFFCKLDPRRIAGKSLDAFKSFAANSVTYTFKFTISENKIKSGLVDFSMPFTNGTFNLGLGAGSDKTRTNLRTLEVSDTFSSLVTGQKSDGSATNLICEKYIPKRIKSKNNWIYPITGNIGMAEVINTYVKLENAAASLTSFSDTLTFTTKFDISANPSVTLSTPPMKQFRLVKADVNYKANRQDEHEVKLVFAKPTPTVKKLQEYTQLFVPTKIEGLTPGTEVGLTVKVPKKSKKKIVKSEGCSVFRFQIDRSTGKFSKVKMNIPSVFSITRGQEDSAIRASVRESRRLEDVVRRRELDVLIGR